MPGPSKPCKYCKSLSHWPFQCYQRPKAKALQKPRKAIKHESYKTKGLRFKLRAEWYELNPPDAHGEWTCYLQISPLCPIKVNEQTLNREHVRSKARAPELKYDVTNIRPACSFCNERKRSLDIVDLVAEFPHLRQYL